MPETRTPRVSVCIPTYGHGGFLPIALESVLTQAMQDFEVVVSDDGSAEWEQVVAIIRSFRDPRIRFHRLPQHAGVAANRNACMDIAGGKYIAWLDADDVYEPDALARLSATLDAHPETGFAHAGFRLIDEAGGELKAWSSGPCNDTFEPSRDAFKELLACNYVTTSTVMVRRSVQVRAGFFDASIGRSSTDWNMWLRLALQGDVAYVHQPLARYRTHADTISAQTASSGERLKCDEHAVLDVLAQYRDDSPGTREMLAIAKAGLSIRWLQHAQAACRAKDTRGASRGVLRAFRLARTLVPIRVWRTLIAALRGSNEYAAFQAFRGVLAYLYEPVSTTRYGDQVRKLAVPDGDWESALSGCASAVRHATEEGSLVAAIDKHDPTLLHLSNRGGIHFPETDRYPRDDEEAIQGVISLPAKGIRYFVIPGFSFWWLDFYRGLAAYLQEHYASLWDDSRCKIYELN